MSVNLENKKKKSKKKNKLYCGNCGKVGHLYKNCREPIVSFGIINCLILTDDGNLIKQIENKLTFDDNNSGTHDKININKTTDGINFTSDVDLETFGLYANNIKFLLIRRKHSLGYIQFVRGRYFVDNVDGIIFLFKQMTQIEINKIGTYSFEELWNDLWTNDKHKNIRQNEFVASKNKFDKLKNIEDEFTLNLQFYVDNVKPTWTNPEWGFPKGRRHTHESYMMCAIREFQEESGFKDGEYVVLDKISPIVENLIGTNGVYYKHIYYPTISLTDRTPTIGKENEVQINEIGDIGWFTYDKAYEMIRPHHTERKKILTQMYISILNFIISNTNNQNETGIENNNENANNNDNENTNKDMK
jgi:8-oxo-dGTP pyrophosphatase MutT (NUDIX family)